MADFVTLAILAACSAFLSCSETAIIALNKVRLHHMVSRGSRRAKLVYQLVTHLDRVISTILVGNNLVNVTISAIAAALCIEYFGHQWGVPIATVSVTLVLLILCEITPKILAARHAEFLALLLAVPLSALVSVSRPVVNVVTAVSHGLLKLFGVPMSKREPLVTEEEIRLMIEMGRDAGVVMENEKNMLHRIFEFGDTVVRDVIIPRDKIVGIDVRATQEQLLDVLVEEGHSRLPVYDGSLDQLLGVIYAKDILYLWREHSLIVVKDILQPAYIVRPNERVYRILQEFQRRRVQIALVRDDERIVGLVTLEDLLEEIVGELEETSVSGGKD